MGDKKGEGIEINGQNVKYTKDYMWSCVYGETVCIASYTYDWSIKIENIPEQRIFVGIAPKRTEYIHTSWAKGVYGVYSVKFGGYRIANGQPKDDEIEMSLDLADDMCTLSYKVNGIEKDCIKIKNIPNDEYNLFVGFFNELCEISLMR